MMYFFRSAVLANFLASVVTITGCGESAPVISPDEHGVYHVYPGEEIQPVIDSAAQDPKNKHVKVHAGTYRPSVHAQAMIYFNAQHDGILLEAEDDVILSAANPTIADRSSESYPAIVNHVVYFGDGISRKTIFRGFNITGANHYVTRSENPICIERLPHNSPLKKKIFYYQDGGGVKIFGRSYPTIENVEMYNNYASPCAGGLSIEHQGFNQQSPLLQNCIFRHNTSQVTGSAVDVLPGSSATIDNCLFVDNIANTGIDYIGQRSGHEFNKVHGSGALTVFPRSSVKVTRCTFTNNWNGVDDKGQASIYRDSIFWNNTAPGGISEGQRYEIDILDANGVSGCWIHGDINDLHKTVDPKDNVLNAPDPQFDDQYRPQAKKYRSVGYRPKD